MSRAKCRHPVSDHVWSLAHRPYWTGWKTCDSCGHWLSLGPSNDDSEAVKFEIALANVISDLHALWEPGKVRTSLVGGAIEWAALTGRCALPATVIASHDHQERDDG